MPVTNPIKRMTGKYKRKIRRGIVLPLQQFINREKSAGVVLGISIVVAMVLANSPWSEDYFHLFEHKLGFFFDGEPYLYHSLHHWINDGLMSMFFFVVGLELKREFIGGELSDPRNTVLPIGAAVAGMLVPALIYTLLNGGTPAAGGWGIPMATDIAFSLAIIYLLGDRVPLAAKVFLTTLAIVDDLGAVVVIALFYTSEISLINLAVGVIILLVMWGANKMGVKNVLFYGLLGIGGVWVAFLMSGIHATIAAVLAAFVIPADARLSEANYLSRAARHLRHFGKMQPNGVSTLAHEQLEVIARMKSDTRDAIPPSQRLEHAMHPFVSFVVMPIFALANARLGQCGGVVRRTGRLAGLLHECGVGRGLGPVAGQAVGHPALHVDAGSSWGGSPARGADVAARRGAGFPGLHRLHDVDVHLHPGLYGRHDAAPSQVGHLRGVHPGRGHRLSAVEEIR